jgi:hypothetical protein
MNENKNNITNCLKTAKTITKSQNPNLSNQEAEKLFEKLVDERQIAMDQEGLWRRTQ